MAKVKQRDEESGRIEPPPEKPKGCHCYKPDFFMPPIEVVTGVSATGLLAYGIVTAQVAATLAGSIFGVLALGAGAAHLLWRRDAAVADLHRVNQELDHTVNEMEETANKVNQVTEELEQANKKLEQEKKDRIAAQQKLEEITAKITKNAADVNASTVELQKENASLKQQNDLLARKLEEIYAATDRIKKGVKHFHESNKQFKKNVGDLESASVKIDQEDDEIKKVLEEDGKELDEHIAALAKMIARGQESSNQLKELYAGQIKSLQEINVKLSENIHQVDLSEDAARARAEELEKIGRAHV